MFIVLLRFSTNRGAAKQYMEGHNVWLKRGFDDGIFLLSGSIKPSDGGAILANSTTMEDLEARVAQDPFVAEAVVTAEIVEISPSRSDERLAFMLG
jgi:uncharacterized protein YciI